MNTANLALGLAIIGVASALFLQAQDTEPPAGLFAGGGYCGAGIGNAASTNYCTAEPAEDDVAASDPSDGGADPSTPSTGRETPMSLRGSSFDPASYT